VALTFKNFYFNHKNTGKTGTPYIFSDAPIASSTNYRRIRYTLKDVEYVVGYKKPDYLYCHLTTVGQNFNFDKFLHNVTMKFKEIPIVFSGQLTNTYEKKIYPPVVFKKSFAEVMDFISAL
jgi:hypothetical protein